MPVWTAASRDDCARRRRPQSRTPSQTTRTTMARGRRWTRRRYRNECSRLPKCERPNINVFRVSSLVPIRKTIVAVRTYRIRKPASRRIVDELGMIGIWWPVRLDWSCRETARVGRATRHCQVGKSAVDILQHDSQPIRRHRTGEDRSQKDVSALLNDRPVGAVPCVVVAVEIDVVALLPGSKPMCADIVHGTEWRRHRNVDSHAGKPRHLLIRTRPPTSSTQSRRRGPASRQITNRAKRKRTLRAFFDPPCNLEISKISYSARWQLRMSNYRIARISGDRGAASGRSSPERGDFRAAWASGPTDETDVPRWVRSRESCIRFETATKFGSGDLEHDRAVLVGGRALELESQSNEQSDRSSVLRMNSG